jgi:transcriptional regulator with XRE-family HTH domain
METVGDRIRMRRTDLKWTQDQLATQAGISKGFLSDVERGLRNVSSEFLLKLAEALGVTTDFLMKGETASVKRAEVKIPRSLAEFAESEQLTFQKTVTVLEMRLQIKGHRGSSQSEDLEKFDWKKFYEAVKPFMK